MMKREYYGLTNRLYRAARAEAGTAAGLSPHTTDKAEEAAGLAEAIQLEVVHQEIISRQNRGQERILARVWLTGWQGWLNIMTIPC